MIGLPDPEASSIATKYGLRKALQQGLRQLSGIHDKFRQQIMSTLFDIFEVLPDGGLVWRAAINGKNKAIRKIAEMAFSESTELRLIHLPTKAIVATVTQPKQTAVM